MWRGLLLAAGSTSCSVAPDALRLSADRVEPQLQWVAYHDEADLPLPWPTRPRSEVADAVCTRLLDAVPRGVEPPPLGGHGRRLDSRCEEIGVECRFDEIVPHAYARCLLAATPRIARGGPWSKLRLTLDEIFSDPPRLVWRADRRIDDHREFGGDNEETFEVDGLTGHASTSAGYVIHCRGP